MKKVFLIVGESGSGKSSIINELEERGYTAVQSYTTRPPRFEDETGHIFITEEEYIEFRNAGEIVAYTLFDGSHYFSTHQQLIENQLYIIDKDGIDYLKENVTDIEFITIYIKVDKQTRIDRMYKRGDKKDVIVKRMINDLSKFKGLEFDYAIPNNNLQESTDLVEYIIRRNRMEMID